MPCLGQRGQKTTPCPAARSRITQIREYPPRDEKRPTQFLLILFLKVLNVTIFFHPSCKDLMLSKLEAMPMIKQI